MIEETTFTAHASALRVWSVLSDLDGYARWHPDYRFRTRPIRGYDFVLSWRFLDDRRVNLGMYRDDEDKPNAFGWRGGPKGLLILRERYRITAAANGVEVRHTFECRGLVGALLGWVNRKGIRDGMAAQDAALLAFLEILGRSAHPRATQRRGAGRKANGHA